MKTTTRQEQAENLLIQLDAAQCELQEARCEKAFNEWKDVIAALTGEIEKLGYQVERCVNGWRLASATQQVVVEETSVEPMLHSDEQGLYVEVPSSTGKTVYTVRVCARWLKTVSCSCPRGKYGKDCDHQAQIDAQLRDMRPTFSEWIADKGASPETVASLLYGSGKGLAHAA